MSEHTILGMVKELNKLAVAIQLCCNDRRVPDCRESYSDIAEEILDELNVLGQRLDAIMDVCQKL